jgi:hypothetical protein
MAGAESAECFFLGAVYSFFNKLADHPDEPRMRTDRAGADKVDAEFRSELFGFGVEVVEHFHVVRDKADWHDDDVLHFICATGQIS